MMAEQHIWRDWAGFLHRWGVHQLVASWLEWAGPLNILGAQLIYVSQPFLSIFVKPESLSDLARILEKPDEVKEFIRFLREENSL